MSKPKAPYYHKTSSDTHHWETSCSKNSYPVPGWDRLGYTSSSRVNSSLTISATRTEIDNEYPFMVPYAGLHMETANGYITGWNDISEVHLLNPAYPEENQYSSYFYSLPSVNITFYYKVR